MQLRQLIEASVIPHDLPSGKDFSRFLDEGSYVGSIGEPFSKRFAAVIHQPWVSNLNANVAVVVMCGAIRQMERLGRSDSECDFQEIANFSLAEIDGAVELSFDLPDGGRLEVEGSAALMYLGHIADATRTPTYADESAESLRRLLPNQYSEIDVLNVWSVGT